MVAIRIDMFILKIEHLVDGRNARFLEGAAINPTPNIVDHIAY